MWDLILFSCCIISKPFLKRLGFFNFKAGDLLTVTRLKGTNTPKHTVLFSTELESIDTEYLFKKEMQLFQNGRLPTSPYVSPHPRSGLRPGILYHTPGKKDLFLAIENERPSKIFSLPLFQFLFDPFDCSSRRIKVFFDNKYYWADPNFFKKVEMGKQENSVWARRLNNVIFS